MDKSIQKAKMPFQQRFQKRLGLALAKKKLIIWLAVLGLLAALVLSMFLPKYYQATGKVFLNESSVNNSFLQNSGSIEKDLSLFDDPDFIKTILDKLSKQGISINSREYLESKEMRVDDKTYILGLIIISDEAVKAAEIANISINEFYNTSILNSHSYLIHALNVIKQRESAVMETINQGLNSSGTAVISSLNLDQENLISQIAEFESELENIELDNQIYSFELNRLKQVLNNKFSNLSEEILFLKDDDLKRLLEQLQRMQSVMSLKSVSAKLGGIEIRYLWPEIYDVNTISEVEKNFFSGLNDYIIENYTDQSKGNESFLRQLVRKLFEVQIKVDGIDLTKSTIFNNITSLEDRFNRIPFGSIEEARKSRSRKFNNSLLIKIRAKKESLTSNQENYFAEVDYITEASIPDSYFSPNIIVNSVIGAVAGLLLGFLIALSRNSVKIELIESGEDLDLHGFKLLSQIPAIPPGSPILFDAHDENGNKKLDPKVLQAFSSIETFIKYGSLDKALKSVLIASGQSGEGKSIIASNLAIALANSGNKVLLVDINLKYPVLYKFFKVKSTPSLAHYLFRKKELKEIVRKTHNKNLDLITCIEFPQNPSVIMTSERMKNFIEMVKSDYDYVVYDSCATNLLEETVKFAELMDEVIVVVRAGKTKLSELFSFQSLLNENGLSDFEIILNDVKK